MKVEKLIIKGKINILKGFSEDDFENLKKYYIPIINIQKNEFKQYLYYINDNCNEIVMNLLKAMSDKNNTYIMRYEELSSVINNIGINMFTKVENQKKFRIINNSLTPNQYFYFSNEFVSNNRTLLEEYIEKDIYRDINNEDEYKLISNIYSDITYYKNSYFYAFSNLEDMFSDMEKIYIIDQVDESKLEKTSIYTDFIELANDTNSYFILMDKILSKSTNLIYISFKDKKARNVYEKYVRKLPKIFSDIKIMVVDDTEKINEIKYRLDILDIFRNYWGSNFNFRELDFYDNPDDDENYKTTKKISQGMIIEDIIKQAERAYSGDESYKDIFITAPTGAGKSVLFQISALYLAEKYHKVTIVISPLIALMQDQLDDMRNKGIYNSTYINSSLTQIEKEDRIDCIKKGEIDIIYLAPETLLAYNIKNIIGDRELGLFIIDEAHIVTTWGKNFRPDYWYLGSYISSIRKNQNQFPICTLTATAVYYGREDMYEEITLSLNMKRTSTYLGKVVRNNISFNYNIDKHLLGREEYEKNKLIHMLKKVEISNKENKKILIYFPFATQVEKYYNKLRLKFPGKVTKYHGKLKKEEKELNAEDFKKGNKLIMLCTKAFGMGINVPDFSNAYHFALTGNLNDYVQEFGRLARDYNIQGQVMMNFFDNDFKYINQLFGMSIIQDYQIKAVLKRLYDLYLINKRERNFLVTPKDFAQIFIRNNKIDDEDIERKLKTTLLLIEKDSRNRSIFPMVISRPRSLFTTIFLSIIKEYENDLLDSKYGRYFKRVSDGRKNSKEYRGRYNQECFVSDLGDTFIFNAKECWINEYPEYSFAKFKYLLLSEKEKLEGFILKEKISQKYRLEIISFTHEVSKLKNILSDHLEKVNSILDDFKDKGKMFTIEQFRQNLISKGYSNEISYSIANSYIPFVNMSTNTQMNFGTSISFNRDYEKYQIKNRKYNTLLRNLLTNNVIKSRLDNCNNKEIIIYFNISSNKNEIRFLYLLEMFGLINFKIKGGDQPEIFIRINEPFKLERLIQPNSNYRNELLENVKTRHKNSALIIKKFIKELDNDYLRWDFIEDYYLGKDVLTIAYNNDK
ncbi:ATP-dependent DNA helicase RecQ [Mycoplasmatota bacterium]|nr:ATP-dependent DNA helicase RecQ [Mycoplasmatota bacterium]